MKLAVGLFGIHYIDELNHWMGWQNGVDYRECYHNQFTHIYHNNDVKYYSSTYHSSISAELMDDYKFNSIIFTDIDNTKENAIINRNRIFKSTIKLMLEDAHNYDAAFITRYDLKFKQHLYNLDIDFNKVNFLTGARWGNDMDLVDDNVYVIPKTLLKSFYDTLETIPDNISAHQYHKWFENYNLMISGHWFSHENPFYDIVRIPLTNKM